ncbi:Nicotinamidase [Porphyridium purpureum]|uniref:nicotinamidase n=1 Tax=Porphyridium purpureum TaxID=35688 RepID=A0A5J4Z568_PORPP|nr:Nicotinamidase [Porphyridium purpureum]|eukprot:POR2437..scf295_1
MDQHGHESVMDNLGILVIDCQNDFCEGGSLAVPHAERAIAQINALRRVVPRDKVSLVVTTADYHPPRHVSFAATHGDAVAPFTTIQVPARRSDDAEVQRPAHEQILWPQHCVAGTKGADLHPALELDGAELLFHKGVEEHVDAYSAFFDNTRTLHTGLHDVLSSHKVTRLVCVGIATDVCVYETVKHALELGYQVLVVTECCAAVSEENARAALADMQARGAIVVPDANALVQTI